MAKQPTGKNSSGEKGSGSNSASNNAMKSQKAAFKEELASRIESEHEAKMYDRGIARDDIEIVLGVGDYQLYFEEFVSNFRRTRTNKLPPEEAQEPKLDIKERSKQRWRKPRRKPRGKLKSQRQDNNGKGKK